MSDTISMLVSGTYYAAIIENRADFVGRVVVDVGDGTGILSLFAAQVALTFLWSCMEIFFQNRYICAVGPVE